MNHMINFKKHSHQKGAILVSSIIILTLLTIIGVAGLSRSVIDEKMANNSYNTELAFQSSEAALRGGEIFLKGLTAVPTPSRWCTRVPCDIIWDEGRIARYYGRGFTNNWWSAANTRTNDNWWRILGRSITSTNAENKNLPYVSGQPVYLVESMGFIPDDLSPAARAAGEGYHYYRITSRGVGSNQAARNTSLSQVMLQAIYSKRFN